MPGGDYRQLIVELSRLLTGLKASLRREPSKDRPTHNQ
jgi:hypothetical protein